MQRPVADAAIPFRILVGVTGHRQLTDADAVRRRIREALDRLRTLAHASESKPVILDVVSPLAEGADRLVAREILQDPRSRLYPVLPLSPESYREDFTDEASRDEFAHMLEVSRQVRVMPPGPDRNAAYEAAGRYVVDACDVLIAIWDGKPASGRGGTAEIVEYARSAKCPLFVIPRDGAGEASFEPGRGLDTERRRRFD